MNYITNMSQKERIFLDSAVIIGLFSGDDNAEKILGNVDKYVYLYKDFSNFLREFEIDFLAIPEEGIEIASSLAREYKLLPNDALIAATCKHYGITKIATFDHDFDRVDFLVVITL